MVVKGHSSAEPVSVCRDWLKYQSLFATSISVWQPAVQLSQQIRPWGALCMLLDVMQARNTRFYLQSVYVCVSFPSSGPLHLRHVAQGRSALIDQFFNILSVQTYFIALYDHAEMLGQLSL